MPTLEIIKAWKDEGYRETLTPDQQAKLPHHPSGLIELQECDVKEDGSFGLRPVACQG